MIPSIASWVPFMGLRVGHAPYTGQDDFTDPTSGAITWYPAHIENVVVKSEAGGIATVTGQLHIILGAVVAIDPRDRLLVPPPFTSRNSTGAFSTGEDAQVVRVSPTMGPICRQHHTEVWTE